MTDFIKDKELKETTTEMIEHITKHHKLKQSEELLNYISSKHKLKGFLTPFHKPEIVINQFGEYNTIKMLYIVLGEDNEKKDFFDEIMLFHDLHKDEFVKKTVLELELDVGTMYPGSVSEFIKYVNFENGALDRERYPDTAYMVLLDLSLINYVKSYGNSEGK